MPGVQIRVEMHGGRGGLFGDVRQQGDRPVGDGEGTRVCLDTLFASGSNGNLHKECQIFPVESQTDPNMSLLHHLFDLSQTSPFFSGHAIGQEGVAAVLLCR